MRLIKRKLSISTAEKICSGRYGAELRSYNAEALLKEMAKDGFVLADDAS